MDSNEQARKRGGELGRLAGKFVKNAGPRARRFVEESRPKVEKAIEETRPKLQRAVEDARPRVEKAVEEYRPKMEQAGRDAAKYAQEHQDEIKGLAIRGARMRLGPLGMAIDALGIGAETQRSESRSDACPKCGKVNARGSRFCAECGQRLQDDSPA